jgi:hypothetical protein
MSKGFAIQMPLNACLRDQKKFKVEILAASGQWFNLAEQKKLKSVLILLCVGHLTLN